MILETLSLDSIFACRQPLRAAAKRSLLLKREGMVPRIGFDAGPLIVYAVRVSRSTRSDFALDC